MPDNDNNIIKYFPLIEVNKIYELTNKNAFIFKEKGKTYHKDLQEYTFIKNLSQVNFFIGNNNVGKSRLIRGIFMVIKEAEKNKEHSRKENHFNYFLIEKISGLSTELQDDWEKIVMNNEVSPLDTYLDVIDFFRVNNISWDDNIKNNLLTINIQSPKIYIPILRDTKPLTSSMDSYKERVFKDFFKKENIDMGRYRDIIFTGQSIYSDLRKHLLGKRQGRELVEKIETFLKTHFFEGKTVSLTPLDEEQNDVVHILIGEEERAIYDLGDGIQAILLLLFPLFLNADKEMMVFIEEPETHLHPKWQRLFIETIIKKFPKHQFFITTHSNIFLNIPNTSTYRLSKENENTIIEHITLSQDKLDLLQELGYKTSDLLQANFIIWVEGASDMVYIEAFLTCVAKDELRMGVDYIVMLYGGTGLNAIINSEKDIEEPLGLGKILSFLNPNFAIIIDSDKKLVNGEIEYPKKTKTKHIAVEEATETYSNFFWITSKRELENHIPLNIFVDALYTYHKIDKEDYKIIFADDNENFGDRGAYKTIETSNNSKKLSHHIKMRPSAKIELPKEIIDNQFDVDNGLKKLIDTDDKEAYKLFIEQVEKAMLEARYTRAFDKTKVARVVSEMLEKDKSLWDTFDSDITTKMQELYKAIKNASGIVE